MVFETSGRTGIKPPDRMPLPKPKTAGNAFTQKPFRHSSKAAPNTMRTPVGSKTITGWPSQQKSKHIGSRVHTSFPKPIIRRGVNRVSVSNKSPQYKTNRPFVSVANPSPVRKASTPVYKTYQSPYPQAQRRFSSDPVPKSYPSPYETSDGRPISPLHTNPYVTPDDRTCKVCTDSKDNKCPVLSHFAIGSAELTFEHSGLIHFIADQIIAADIKFVSVTGHTDVTGTDDNNFKLGRRRSINVTNALRKAIFLKQKNLVDSIFWKMDSKGESQPVSKTDAGLNRRVTVCLIKNICC